MSSPSDSDLTTFFEEGIALCDRWEELAAQQFSALEQGDVTVLSLITAGQSRLVGQLATMEGQWQQMSASWRRVPAGAEGHEPPDARLTARRREFVVAAQHVFGANYRNGKALGVLAQLGAIYEPAILPRREKTYDRQGMIIQRSSVTVRGLDREG